MIRSHSILSVNRKGKGQTIDRTLITRSKEKHIIRKYKRSRSYMVKLRWQLTSCIK